jgi:PAS domain S-box-containing protein
MRKARSACKEAFVNEATPDYRSLFALNPRPMWIFDVQTLDFLDVNEAASRHYGYSRREFLKRTLRDIRPREDRARLARRVTAIRDEPTTSATLWRHRKKDGTLIDVEVSSFRVTFMNRPARVVSISDVTERLRAQSTIRAVLSLRERQVLEHVAAGHTNREVAELLRLSVKSVEAYRARVMSKLGLKTRAELVRYTLECGLLRVPPAATPTGR